MRIAARHRLLHAPHGRHRAPGPRPGAPPARRRPRGRDHHRGRRRAERQRSGARRAPAAVAARQGPGTILYRSWWRGGRIVRAGDYDVVHVHSSTWSPMAGMTHVVGRTRRHPGRRHRPLALERLLADVQRRQLALRLDRRPIVWTRGELGRHGRGRQAAADRRPDRTARRRDVVASRSCRTRSTMRPGTSSRCRRDAKRVVDRQRHAAGAAQAPAPLRRRCCAGPAHWCRPTSGSRRSSSGTGRGAPASSATWPSTT